MADINFDDVEAGYPVARTAAATRWVNLAGAACSVCLVLGLVVWGYKLAVRDVTGIPVVRALEGPLRIAPENPGGEVAMHQGLSVNAVAAVGTAAPLPESVILAPAEIELNAEDAPGLAVLASASAPMQTPVQPLAASMSIAAPVAISPEPQEVLVQPQPQPDPEAFSDIAVEQPVPATEQDAVAAALAIALADDGSVEADAPVPVVAHSVRPMPRPSRGETAVISDASAVTESAPAPTEVDAASIPAGTRLVQLGAFDDEAGARAEWSALQSRFPELIGTKAMVVQSAQSGGRTFYRLRAHGFENEDETRRFCAALLAENASCIAVAQR
ncbi:MAG: SPOR domain-containing protein [Cypionkella sp.]